MKKILSLVLSVMIIAVFLTGCGKKEKLFPIEMTEENIQKIAICTNDGYTLDENNNKVENQIMLNEKDYKKAISDMNKLKKIDEPRPTGNQDGTTPRHIYLFVYTKKGIIEVHPMISPEHKNKEAHITFNMNDFPGEFDYVNLPGGETINFYANGVSSNSMLREEYLMKVMVEYQNGTRK